MKTYLINYSHKNFIQSQKKNSETAIRIGGVNQVIEYGYQDLSSEFIKKNSHILSQNRGAGYWIWKPYIILKTLEEVNDGDIVFYSDSGAEFISSVKPLIDICKSQTDGILVFNMEPTPENKEVLQTKKDAFVIMGCNSEEYIESWARLASFSVWCKNEFSLRVVKDWLSYVEDERVSTDIPNQCGIEEDRRHIAHRHDQSAFSLITKKYKIKSYPDPSQWGNGYRGDPPIYSQIINHTRNRI